MRYRHGTFFAAPCRCTLFGLLSQNILSIHFTQIRYLIVNIVYVVA